MIKNKQGKSEASKDGFHQPKGVYTQKPNAGVSIKGRVLNYDGERLHLEYGIEDYYADKDTALELQNQVGEISVDVAVDRSGNTVIKKLKKIKQGVIEVYNKERYRIYSQYLRDRYGEKVYKIPINLPVTCPNRDGTAGCGGCIFCGEEGAGFENLSQFMPVSEQLDTNMTYIREKYKAQKFIAYFQNFTNTYLPLVDFKKYMGQACRDNVVEIAISTRPDCIHDDYLEYLQELKADRDLTITIELGLQTVNYHTLKKINRGHTLAEFLDAVLRIKKYGLETCVHLILNLPWDDEDDVIEDAKFLSALGIEQVKLHSLYIRSDTVMGRMYERGEFEIIPMESYVHRVILFLEYLSPHVVVQRLIGRAPEENSLFCNWNTSWWKIKDRIDESMSELDSFQGKRFDYLHGRALRNLHK